MVQHARLSCCLLPRLHLCQFDLRRPTHWVPLAAADSRTDPPDSRANAPYSTADPANATGPYLGPVGQRVRRFQDVQRVQAVLPGVDRRRRRVRLLRQAALPGADAGASDTSTACSNSDSSSSNTGASARLLRHW